MEESLTRRTANGKRRFASGNFLRRMVKEKPLGMAGGIITLILLLVGVFADLLAPYGVNEVSMENILEAPSAKFWLGTDSLGRDVFSRVIHGARISVIVGLVGTTLSAIVSLIIGILSGYLGRGFDLIVQRVVDTVMCLPSLILMMVIMSVIGTGMWQLIIVIGLIWGFTGSRLIRSAVISIKQNAYVDASRSIGCSTSRMLIRHILPNILAPAIILFTTRVPNVIITEASLSFLGFGIPPPAASWGSMLGGRGRSFMFKAPWTVIWPGVALSIVVYGINMFGDAVRDLLDPRLRGGAGRYAVTSKRKSAQAKELLLDEKGRYFRLGRR